MDIYHRALKTWGKNPQMLQVIEEMSELIKEILKKLKLVLKVLLIEMIL